MHRLIRLEALFSPRVILIWRIITIFLLVASLIVPLSDSSQDSNAVLGRANLIILAIFFAVVSLNVFYGQISSFLFCLLVVIGIISFFAYVVLNIAVCFRQRQQQFRIRFWLLGLSCIGIVLLGWSLQHALLWGFNIVVSAVVSGLLLEYVSYVSYRRRSS